ncbi:hypothetical protein AB1286_05940 [Trinickia sp. NRRL B-1857]|uniref:hypothetical protein n=1 Tax=Trinickia sp. NRRL B-1857 TaxID=3162879 RepID=UPI003D268018
MDTLPYNRGGNCVTLAAYKYKAGVPAGTAADCDAPIFVIHDQFGNSGKFTIEASNAETDWLSFVDG